MTSLVVHVCRATAIAAVAVIIFAAGNAGLPLVKSAAAASVLAQSPPTLGPSPTPKNSPLPNPSPVLTVAPTPLPTPTPAPPATTPPRSMAYVNGQSVDVSGTDRCPTDNDPPAPPYYSSAFNEGSTYQGFTFRAGAPSSPTTSINVNVTSSSALSLQLFGPSPVNGQSTMLINRTSTGGAVSFSYFAGGAPGGAYELDVGGTVPYSGNDCGKRMGVQTTTVTWTGNVQYSP